MEQLVDTWIRSQCYTSNGSRLAPDFFREPWSLSLRAIVMFIVFFTQHRWNASTCLDVRHKMGLPVLTSLPSGILQKTPISSHGTHLTRVINLSGTQSMIELSPYQDGHTNNTRLFEVTNTRNTLEPCLNNKKLQPFTRGVVKVHVWKIPCPLRASVSCCPAISSNFINWATRNVTAIYFLKNPFVETSK